MTVYELLMIVTVISSPPPTSEQHTIVMEIPAPSKEVAMRICNEKGKKYVIQYTTSSRNLTEYICRWPTEKEAKGIGVYK